MQSSNQVEVNQRRVWRDRTGAILVLAAACMIIAFAFLAFTVDVGYVVLLKSQLQNAADAAALAATSELGQGATITRETAQEIALANYAGSTPIVVTDSDVELGVFDLSDRSFALNEATPNAVRVTTRVVDRPLFFAPIIGHDNCNISASAISMVAPRDIVFVVDLSGSMNDDTEPAWATESIDDEFAPDGYPTVGSTLMQQLFDDFGYGTFPGDIEHIGEPLGVSQNNYAYYYLTKNYGPLTKSSIPSTYRISSSNSNSTRKTKAYKWMIDYQIAEIMPNALPIPDSSINYSYWEKYLDYVIYYSSSSLPPNQDGDRIDDFNNPNRSTFPGTSSSAPRAFRNKIGYRTYVQFMMDWGRDRSPDVSNSYNASSSSGTKTPLSVQSPYCPYHSEVTAGGSFDFPPREQPTHAARRSLIAAIQVVNEQNAGVPAGVGDQVAIVTFDAISSYHAPVVRVPLTTDFDAVMQSCTTMQAVADINASTATEKGLIVASQHLDQFARSYTKKVVVLVTDGVPNIYSSSSSQINNYISNNPSSEFYTGNEPYYNSVLMQADMLNTDQTLLFAVAMGLGADYDFMDRIATINGTDENGESPRGSGNPAQYEQRLTEIFEEIIQSPGSRLVR